MQYWEQQFLKNKEECLHDRWLYALFQRVNEHANCLWSGRLQIYRGQQIIDS